MEEGGNPASGSALQVSVHYFGVLRERYIRKYKESVGLAADATVDDLIAVICTLYPDFHEVRSVVRIGVNEDLVGPRHRLRSGDVVAFIPPVAGG